MAVVEREKREVNLQRALVIGIGGCGAEVIKRLRRLLIDRFGRFENIPIVRFLYLDTDPNWLRTLASEVEEDIRLPDSERFDAQFPDASGLYRGIREGNYPHFSWFMIEKLQPHTKVTEGAGTIRQLGRLCFWQHASKIRKQVESLLTDLNNDTNARFMNEKYNVVVDPGINVHIIAGLAGGTGSGMILDTAYLSRQILKTGQIAGAHQVAGYLIMPGAFRDLGGANALPNGYAALKELNYYSYMYAPGNPLAAVFGQPEWEANYTGQDIDRVFSKEGKPPFDYCYLLDDRNPNVALHRHNIFAMIARSLFHEFTLSFATFKRSLRANIKNRIVSNDKLDCPVGFMSFGQSAVFLPREEISRIMQNQLALRAVQQWIDKAAKPLDAITGDQGQSDIEAAIQASMVSMQKQAGEAQTISAVRSFLVRELIPSVGLKDKDALSAIMAEERERLADIPFGLVEAEKQRWIAEKWDYDKFEGMVSDAWRRWKADFNDEGPDPMAWGEKMRRMVANKGQTEKEYRRKLHDRVFAMFEDTQKYGPSWSMCVAQQLHPYFTQLKDYFLKEANDSVAIATILGNVTLINAAAGGRGPSLSAIIEQRIGQEFDALDQAVRSFNPLSKRERVGKAAYEYLNWCALWCRAKVEERGRRLVAELADNLSAALGDFEREMIEDAGVIARLQTEFLKCAQEWGQKAGSTENIGELLFNATLLKVVEGKIAERQGDQYNPSTVAQRALKRLGKNLRDLRQDEVPQLIQALLAESREAIGDLDEKMLQDTCFGAYDILSAEYSEDNDLDQKLRQTIDSGAPFVILNAHPPGGNWVQGNDLLEISGAGIRGGYIPPDQDQDRERVRIISSLKRVGWDAANAVQAIDDSSQIVFFQECGGFPLRTLAGIEEMKQAYEEHRKLGGPPLHILRDEMADRYPDILPPIPDNLKRAKMLQTVAVPLGFILPRTFPHPDGSGRTIEMYAYLRQIPELNEQQPVPFGEKLENVGMKLAYNPDLTAEIEKAIDSKLANATADQKAEYQQILKQYLDKVKENLRRESPDLDPENSKVYQQEREDILAIIRKYGLVSEQTQ